MMNTLANHGYLHRDGLNLTEAVVVKALQDGLNFDTSLSETMFKMALPANPDPNATWFTLWVTVTSSLGGKSIFILTYYHRDQLNRHNVLEHDGSLRYDIQHPFATGRNERKTHAATPQSHGRLLRQ